MSANDKQVSGTHYSKFGTLQHWDVVHHFDLDYFQGQITKYVMRWKDKNGVQDLKKALHFLEKYIEIQEEEDATEALREPLENLGQTHTKGSLFYEAQVKPTGVVGFTYEGGSSDYDLYKCNACNKEVRFAPGRNPHYFHQCVDSGVATSAYTNQG